MGDKRGPVLLSFCSFLSLDKVLWGSKMMPAFHTQEKCCTGSNLVLGWQRTLSCQTACPGRLGSTAHCGPWDKLFMLLNLECTHANKAETMTMMVVGTMADGSYLEELCEDC